MKKYSIPGIPTLISILMFIFEKWFSNQLALSLPDFPWGFLSIIFAFFLVGVFYSDLFNDQSALRQYINKISKIVNVDDFVLANDTENNQSFYEAVIFLKFLKAYKSVDCTLEITQYVDLERAKKTFVIFHDTFENVTTNLHKKITVSRYPQRVSNNIPVNYPYWHLDPNNSWAGDGTHLVTLRLSTGIYKQTERFLISSIRNVGAGPEPVILFGAPKDNDFLHLSSMA